MSASDSGQVVDTAANVYDEFFVPALFAEWAIRVADAVGAQPGQRVLDVACGTGVLARMLTERVGPAGSVVGLDRNPGMLAVAKRKAPHIEWRQGSAEALPFNADDFDAVTSQFGLMFFEDKPAALKEMARVLRPGGRCAVAVWDALDQTPGYAAMASVLHRLFGEQVADALRAPFSLGRVQDVKALLAAADLSDAAITTLSGTARFPSIQAWVHTEIKGWVLADALDDAQVQRLLAEAERDLQPFVTPEGTVAFKSPAHIVTFMKQASSRA